MHVQPEIDVDNEIRKSIDFIKNYMLKHPFLKSVVLGISGGQDSTLTGKLAQLAITELRNETSNSDYQFIAVRLPYGEQADEEDAMDAINFIGADKVLRVNIKPATDANSQTLEEIGVPIIVKNIIGFGIIYAVWKYKPDQPNDNNNNQELDKS